MENMILEAGSTDVTTYFVLRTAATGVELTGATITDIDLQYVRCGATPSAKVDATALDSVGVAHADNKAIEVDGTDAPGLYRVDWPDAAFASGVREVILTVKYATAFTEHMRVELSPDVTLAAAQGAVEFAGQVKITATAIGEGALHIVNESPITGYGVYGSGSNAGQYNVGTAAGSYGMHNVGVRYGQVNQSSGTSGIGQYNFSGGTTSYGQGNQGTLYGTYNSGGTSGTGMTNTGATGQSNKGTTVDVDPSPTTNLANAAPLVPVS